MAPAMRYMKCAQKQFLSHFNSIFSHQQVLICDVAAIDNQLCASKKTPRPGRQHQWHQACTRRRRGRGIAAPSQSACNCGAISFRPDLAVQRNGAPAPQILDPGPWSEPPVCGPLGRERERAEDAFGIRRWPGLDLGKVCRRSTSLPQTKHFTLTC